MRDAIHTVNTHDAARIPRLSASSHGAMAVTAMRSGMMIGAEKGRSESTSASRPVGFRSTGLTNITLLTFSRITGVAACFASCSVFTDDPTAAKSEEQKMN